VFVVPSRGHQSANLESEVAQSVIRQMGRPFAPDRVVVVPSLPKSRSFKILRRVIRDIAEGVDNVDLSAVDNPESLQSIPRISVARADRPQGKI